MHACVRACVYDCDIFIIISIYIAATMTLPVVKDRHQWLGREFRGPLSLNMDKSFLKAIVYVLHH